MPLLSVVMITYNHEKYIKDAIESVLNQVCNFNYELIVSNDASPDNTDKVIKEILSNHPKANLIKYFNQESNIGMMANSFFALNKSAGKYIAFCEGDDFWTSNDKLQTQVDFLENNSDYIMCFHKVKISQINQNDTYAYPNPKHTTLYLKDIIREHYIPTCSLVFRNNSFNNGYPTWLYNSISGDIPLEILLSSKGKTKYIPIEMACYRRNVGGISQSPKQIAKMRAGYIYMYTMLLLDLGIIKGYYLVYRILRLILGGFKNIVFNKLRKPIVR
jgi:glycosyltransferase involved in cell wall biosynthesis